MGILAGTIGLDEGELLVVSRALNATSFERCCKNLKYPNRNTIAAHDEA
jgi:hypothetical protein